MLISVAAHCLEEACAAEREGADMVVLGAVFATGSHPGVQTIGLHGVETVAKAVAIPVIAIGGVTDANARACIEVGARGIAVIGAIHDSADPRAAAAKLRSAVGAA
jgi:thiamine-phosphate diphosphorylase